MSAFSRLRYTLRCSPLLRTRCRQANALLQDYLDGHLDSAATDLLRTHLACCRPCGLEAEVYLRLRDALAAGHTAPPAAVRRLEEFADRLLDHNRPSHPANRDRRPDDGPDPDAHDR